MTESSNSRFLRVPSSVDSVGESGGCGFIHESEAVKTSDGSGVKHSLSLEIVEVGRDRDDDIVDL